MATVSSCGIPVSKGINGIAVSLCDTIGAFRDGDKEGTAFFYRPRSTAAYALRAAIDGEVSAVCLFIYTIEIAVRLFLKVFPAQLHWW